MDAQLVHVTVLDGKTVKTTWAETRPEAKKAESRFRHEGADRTKVFRGGIAKYRVVGFWK